MLPIVNVDTKIYIRGVVVTKEKVTEKVFENQPNFTVSANATNQSRETVKLAENSIHNIFNKFVFLGNLTLKHKLSLIYFF